MARVRIEDIIEQLKTDIRRALEAAVKEVLPEAEFDSFALFRAFKRAVRRKCQHWERVSDSYVEKV